MHMYPAQGYMWSLPSERSSSLLHHLMTTTGWVREMELLRPQEWHQRVKDQELASCECANHDTTGREAHSCKVHEANFTSNAPKTCHHAALTTGASLVDLGKQSVRWVRDDRCCDTSDDTPC